jgi:hypothetical protein
MEAASTSEMPVNLYQTTERSNLEGIHFRRYFFSGAVVKKLTRTPRRKETSAESLNEA